MDPIPVPRRRPLSALLVGMLSLVLAPGAALGADFALVSLASPGGNYQGGVALAALNHLLLAPDTRLNALPAAAIEGIRAGRAIDTRARFPHHSRRWPVALASRFPASRVYEGAGLTVVEQIGTAALYDALLADADRTDVSYRWDGRNAAVRSGEDRNNGVTYYWIALRSGEQAATIRIEAPVAPAELTQAQRDAMTAIACSVDLNGARLGCYR